MNFLINNTNCITDFNPLFYSTGDANPTFKLIFN